MTTASSHCKDQELTTPLAHQHPILAGIPADIPGEDGGEAQAIQYCRAHPERKLAMSSLDRGDEQDITRSGNRASPSRNKQKMLTIEL